MQAFGWGRLLDSPAAKYIVIGAWAVLCFTATWGADVGLATLAVYGTLVSLWAALTNEADVTEMRAFLDEQTAHLRAHNRAESHRHLRETFSALYEALPLDANRDPQRPFPNFDMHSDLLTRIPDFSRAVSQLETDGQTLERCRELLEILWQARPGSKDWRPTVEAVDTAIGRAKWEITLLYP